MTAAVAVLVPMLGRPQTVDPLRESLAASTDKAHLVWIVTDTDTAVRDATAGDTVVVVPAYQRGDYARKMNAGYRATTEPWLFLGACDIRFHPGWWEACMAKAKAGYKVIGTNDLGNRGTADGRLSTHTLVQRSYVDRHGTIDQPGQMLHEGYWHEFVDNEFTQTAKARGVYGHAPHAHVEHLHWLWGKRDRDEVDADYEQRMADGERLYLKRRRLWT